MNLIDLVEQARAVVRVWDGDRLVAVVLVRYPEMLTCSSELPLDPAEVVYPRGATHTECWSVPVPSSIIPSRPLSTPSAVCVSQLTPATESGKGAVTWPG